MFMEQNSIDYDNFKKLKITKINFLVLDRDRSYFNR